MLSSSIGGSYFIRADAQPERAVAAYLFGGHGGSPRQSSPPIVILEPDDVVFKAKPHLRLDDH